MKNVLINIPEYSPVPIHRKAKPVWRTCSECKKEYLAAEDYGIPCIACTLDVYFLYAIKCNGHVKIGFTAQIQQRFSAFRTCNPYSPELIFIRLMPNRDTAIEVERYIHNMLISYQFRNEWFNYSEEFSKKLCEAYAKIGKE